MTTKPTPEHSPAGEESPVYRPGSAADFDRLYRNAYPRVLGTMLGLLRDRAAAEECTQEAFVRALRAWPRWRPSAPAEAWLHRIAINVAVSHRRRERLRQVGEVVRRLGHPPPAPDPIETSESELMRELAALPPKQAAAIILRHLHGYSNCEIAAALGVPEQTVASRLAAAKRRLRARLRSGGDDESVDSGGGCVTSGKDGGAG